MSQLYNSEIHQNIIGFSSWNFTRLSKDIGYSKTLFVGSKETVENALLFYISRIQFNTLIRLKFLFLYRLLFDGCSQVLSVLALCHVHLHV